MVRPFFAVVVILGGCPRETPKGAPDAAVAVSSPRPARERLRGTWMVADASEMLNRYEGQERTRLEERLAGMTWEFTVDHMLTYQDHKQTHDDAITVVTENDSQVTLRGPQGVQEMTFRPDGTLEMQSPRFGRIVLKRPH